MSFVFNSGLGGYICDKCSKLLDSKNMITKKSKKGRVLHYCDIYCLKKHNAGARRKH